MSTHDPVSYRHEATAEQGHTEEIARRETKARTLLLVEEELAAFLDTEDMVSDEVRAAFATELAAANENAATKRANVIRAITVTNTQIEACKAEETRLRDHRKRMESGLERFRAWVAGVVWKFGQQKKGQTTKTLSCALGTLRAQVGPARVVVKDADAVPMRFKWATVHFDNAADWAWIVNHLATTHDTPAPPGTWRAEFEVSLKRVGEALDTGEDVPGADRNMGGELFLKLS